MAISSVGSPVAVRDLSSGLVSFNHRLFAGDSVSLDIHIHCRFSENMAELWRMCYGYFETQHSVQKASRRKQFDLLIARQSFILQYIRQNGLVRSVLVGTHFSC
jgi:hypothetical protein